MNDLLDSTVFAHNFAFKDSSPAETVERIKKILAEHNIVTQESWSDSGVPHCYSLRISVQGTTFGTNGKGVTKEYALASGYGELMERLQLGLIFKEEQQKDNALVQDANNVVKVPVSELLFKNRKWYLLYADKLRKHTDLNLSAEELLAQYADDEGLVTVLPYYCVNENTDVYMPAEIKNSVYSTNGCAAGNTPEEALVQALSEIVERRYQIHILEQGLLLPEVPEDVLESYPIAHKIISFLRCNGFKVTVKDCSLGDRFPVICVCLVDTTSGRYHTHFGAAPKLQIAIERTLTECFQGRSREKVCQFEDFCKQEDSWKREFLVKDLVKGTSERFPSFFLSSNQPYNNNVGFKGTSNRELLKECFAFFAEKGFDILIRDGSSLGFPTYHVIVPGYSEALPHRLSLQNNEKRYARSTLKVLRNPATASMMDIVDFMNHCAAYNKAGLVRGFCKDAQLPAEIDWREDQYLRRCVLAHTYFTLNKTTNALNEIKMMIPAAPAIDVEYLISIKRYFSMLSSGYDIQTIRSVLDYFHSPDTVLELFGKLENKQNPLDSIVLRCDENCEPDCKLYMVCKKKETDKLKNMIDRKIQALDQTKIASYLRGL